MMVIREKKEKWIFIHMDFGSLVCMSSVDSGQVYGSTKSLISCIIHERRVWHTFPCMAMWKENNQWQL